MTEPDRAPIQVPPLPAAAPWRIETTDLDLTTPERSLLFGILVGRFDGYSTIYSDPARRSPSQKTMRALASLGLVEFIGTAQGGWDRGMWGARLTCVGANAVARHDSPFFLPGPSGPGGPDEDRIRLDGHPGCSGGWLPDGTCTGCRRLRPLDAAAYRDYLTALRDCDSEAHTKQVKGPRLYCIEHGHMRTVHITTTKVCTQRGTDMHDGSLSRI